MPRKGRRRKKTRTHVEEENSQPIAIVAKRGKVSSSLKLLIAELRLVLYPNCPLHFKETSKSSLKDLVILGKYYDVNHLILLTDSQNSCYLKCVSLPDGPTITYKVRSYTLSSDVRKYQKHPVKLQADPKSPPLLIMKGVKDLQLAMLKGMFPTLELKEMKLGTFKRAVLFSKETDYEFRHYSIKATDVVTGTLKKLTNSAIPNLNQFNSVSDWLGAGDESESEYEQPITTAERKVTLRLVELGPRMSLRLHKIQSGVCSGEVLYHAYIHKNKEEVELLGQRIEKRKRDREASIARQDSVLKKRLLKHRHVKSPRKKSKPIN